MALKLAGMSTARHSPLSVVQDDKVTDVTDAKVTNDKVTPAPGAAAGAPAPRPRRPSPMANTTASR